MRKFEVLPHIADIRLKIYGDSLEELYIAALEGMNSIIKGENQLSRKTASNQRIVIDSVDSSALLVDFLSEVLTITHNNKCLYNISIINELNEKHFDCSVEGRFIDGFDEDIKAVTYTESDIIKNSDNTLETIIVFDI